MIELLEPAICNLVIVSYEGGIDKQTGTYTGQGKCVLDNDCVYIGDMLCGLPHGHGNFTWPNGVEYEGDFVKGIMTGRAIYKWPDGSHYEGDIKNGKRHGQGVYQCSSDQVYEGEWQFGKRHGKGRLYYNGAKTCVYEGYWLEGLRHYYGIMKYASGNVYEGEWVKDRKSGKGVMQWTAQNEVYLGQWKDDLPDGYGEHIWGDKTLGKQLCNMYRGDWKAGVRDGMGTFFYSNGSQYSGNWKDNKKEGRGVFVFPDGRINAGSFRNDRMLQQAGLNRPPEDVNPQYRLNIDDILDCIPDLGACLLISPPPPPPSLHSIAASTVTTLTTVPPTPVAAPVQEAFRRNRPRTGHSTPASRKGSISKGTPVVNQSLAPAAIAAAAGIGSQNDSLMSYDAILNAARQHQSTQPRTAIYESVIGELERVLLRYNAYTRIFYRRYIEVATNRRNADKTILSPPNDWNVGDKATYRGKAFHSRLFCMTLDQLKQFAREIGLIGPHLSSYDVTEAFAEMKQHHREVAVALQQQRTTNVQLKRAIEANNKTISEVERLQAARDAPAPKHSHVDHNKDKDKDKDKDGNKDKEKDSDVVSGRGGKKGGKLDDPSTGSAPPTRPGSPEASVSSGGNAAASATSKDASATTANANAPATAATTLPPAAATTTAVVPVKGPPTARPGTGGKPGTAGKAETLAAKEAAAAAAAAAQALHAIVNIEEGDRDYESRDAQDFELVSVMNSTLVPTYTSHFCIENVNALSISVLNVNQPSVAPAATAPPTTTKSTSKFANAAEKNAAAAAAAAAANLCPAPTGLGGPCMSMELATDKEIVDRDVLHPVLEREFVEMIVRLSVLYKTRAGTSFNSPIADLNAILALKMQPVTVDWDLLPSFAKVFYNESVQGMFNEQVMRWKYVWYVGVIGMVPSNDLKFDEVPQAVPLRKFIDFAMNNLRGTFLNDDVTSLKVMECIGKVAEIVRVAQREVKDDASVTVGSPTGVSSSGNSVTDVVLDGPKRPGSPTSSLFDEKTNNASSAASVASASVPHVGAMSVNSFSASVQMSEADFTTMLNLIDFDDFKEFMGKLFLDDNMWNSSVTISPALRAISVGCKSSDSAGIMTPGGTVAVTGTTMTNLNSSQGIKKVGSGQRRSVISNSNSAATIQNPSSGNNSLVGERSGDMEDGSEDGDFFSDFTEDQKLTARLGAFLMQYKY